MTDTQPDDREIEAALRAFYKHTAVQNFPQASRDQMERALEAARPFLPSPDVSGEVLGALLDARDALYNPFEPDNQSPLHYRISSVIANAERTPQSPAAHIGIPGPEEIARTIVSVIVGLDLTNIERARVAANDAAYSVHALLLSLSPVHGAVPGGEALLAQRIEHEPSKLGVEGSNPSERATLCDQLRTCAQARFGRDELGFTPVEEYPEWQAADLLSAAPSPPAQGQGQPPRDVSEVVGVLNEIIALDQREKRKTVKLDPAGNTYEVEMIDGPCARIARAALASAPPAQGEPGEWQPIETAFGGLDDRLDRLCVTDDEGKRVILSQRSAHNISEIAKEWVRSRLTSPPLVAKGREK